MKKRALSLFLAVVMTLGLAAPAFAAEEFLPAEESVAAPMAPEEPAPIEAEAEPAPAEPAPEEPIPAAVGPEEPAPALEDPMPEEDQPAPADAAHVVGVTLDGGVSIQYYDSFNAGWDAAKKVSDNGTAAIRVLADCSSDGVTLTWDKKNATLYLYADESVGNVKVTVPGTSYYPRRSGGIMVTNGTVYLGLEPGSERGNSRLTINGDVNVEGEPSTIGPLTGAVTRLTCSSSITGTLYLNGNNSKDCMATLSGGTYGTVDVHIGGVPTWGILAGGYWYANNADGYYKLPKVAQNDLTIHNVTVMKDPKATAPEANKDTIDYNTDVELVTGGSAGSGGGTMQYAVTTGTVEPDKNADIWTDAVPNAKRPAGRYSVWWRVPSDGTYAGEKGGPIEVVIQPKLPEGFTEPTAKENLVWNGSPQPLLNPGEPAGAFQYSSDGVNWSDPNDPNGIPMSAENNWGYHNETKEYNVYWRTKVDAENGNDYGVSREGVRVHVVVESALARNANGTFFHTLWQAIDAANKSDNPNDRIIELEGNVPYNDHDPNVEGYVIYITQPVTIYGSRSVQTDLEIRGEGTLTVKDGAALSDVRAWAGTSVTVEGGSVSTLSTSYKDTNIGNITFNVNGGRVSYLNAPAGVTATVEEGVEIDNLRVGGGDVTVKGGNISILEAESGTVQLSGGEYDIIMAEEDLKLANLLADGYGFYERYYDYHTNTYGERVMQREDLEGETHLVNVKVRSGNFEASIEGWGGYPTLADAMAAAQSMEKATVKLLRDATADVTVNGGNITLLGNGYTVGGGLTLGGGSLAVSGARLGNVTVNDGSLTVSGGEVTTLTVAGGAAAIGDVMVETLNANGGTTTVSGTVTNLNVTGSGTVVNVTGGEVRTVDASSSGAVNVSGGSVGTLTLSSSGRMSLSNGTVDSLKAGHFSQATISGGTVRELISQNGNAVTVSGGSISSMTVTHTGQTVISGGTVETLTARVRGGSTVAVSGSADVGKMKVENNSNFAADGPVGANFSGGKVGSLSISNGSGGVSVDISGTDIGSISGLRMLNMTGGTVGGKLEISKSCTGTISGGTITGLLGYQGNSLKLSGGTYTQIGGRDKTVLQSMLADGYAFFDQDGNCVTPGLLHENVTVKQIGPAIVTEAPAGQILIFNEAGQELVTKGEVSHGTMLYAVTENGTETPAPESYTEGVPMGTDAGTYYVWWMVKGDQGYLDYTPEDVPIKVTIDKLPVDVTPPKAVEGLKYTSGNQALVTAGEATGGTMWYAVTEIDEMPTDPDKWKEEDISAITGRDAGTYYVWYKAEGNENYDDVGPWRIAVTIEKGDSSVKTPPAVVDGLRFNETAQQLVKTPGETLDGTMMYTLTNSDTKPGDGAWTNDHKNITATYAGTYYVWYKVAGDANHNDFGPEKAGEVTILDTEARIGDEYYLTLEDAVGEDGADKNIVLWRDVTTGEITVGNDVTLSSAEEVNVSRSSADQEWTFVVEGEGSLTVKDDVTVYRVKAKAGTSVYTVGGTVQMLTVDGLEDVPINISGNVTVTPTAGGGAVVEFVSGTANSLKVGNTTVNGEAGDKVTVNKDGSVTVPLKGREVMVLDGRTYTNNGEGDSSVTIYQDGSFVLGNSVSMAVNVPAYGLRLAPGDRVECTAGGVPVTLTGGEYGATVDIDWKGNVTVYEGDVTVKGDVTVAVVEGATATQVGDVIVYVTYEDGTPVEGAAVSMGGAAGTTGASGAVVIKDVPYGKYNVNVTKTIHGEDDSTDDDTVVTAVGTVTVDHRLTDAKANTVVLYSFAVNTDVYSTLPQPPAVEGLDSLITPEDKAAAAAGADTVITVILSANDLSKSVSGEVYEVIRDSVQEKIKRIGVEDPNAVTDLIDVTVAKVVTKDGELQKGSGPLTQTPNLMTLTFPLSDSLKGKLTDDVTEENIFVLRQHGDYSNVEMMRKVSPSYGERARVECYYVEDGAIVIRANRFSVYAFGVSGTPIDADDRTGGGGGGGTSWPAADKTELEKAIAAAEALNEADYTAESWAALETALAAAKDVADDVWPAQWQVDDAAEALQEAMGALEKLAPAVDKSALEAAIDAAEALNHEDYTEETWAGVTDALEAAKGVAADADATQEQVDDAQKALDAAVGALVPAEEPDEVDKSDLEAAIDAAEALNPEDYTEESWAGVQDALAAAKDAAADADATQEDVDAAQKALDAAVGALVPAGEPDEVDKSLLEQTIADAEALNAEDYTPETWAALVEALEAAKAIYADPDATQEEVDDADLVLFAAILCLEEATPELEPPAPPSSGTGWMENESGIYFYKDGELKKNFWVGKIDGASRWDGNWYYVDANGRLLTGMQYLTDLHGGYGWYFLQPTNANGEIGKMLTGWQWVGGEYGTGWFSTKEGSAGKCTYTTELGDWNGSTWVK